VGEKKRQRTIKNTRPSLETISEEHSERSQMEDLSDQHTSESASSEDISPMAQSEHSERVITRSIPDPQLRLYKELYVSVSSIFSLKTKLLANMIDVNGKIIVTGEHLCRLVGLITNKPAESVTLKYESKKEGGCFAKITGSLIYGLSHIKILDKDFTLDYPDEANMLNNLYNISINKILITI
jgi:hypothetical protein